ncbi:hypothetical protein NHQ30_011636 [Ciborinia camelliae]|nr:hypothetical protein NHQ30_011636 [Ciborinia camelliae]
MSADMTSKDKTSRKISERISEMTPEEISEMTPEKVFERISDMTSEMTPEKISEKISEMTLDMPRYLDIEKVVGAIQAVLNHSPGLSSRKIHSRLLRNETWPLKLHEVAVEACLVKNFGMRISDTRLMAAMPFTSDAAIDEWIAGCLCEHFGEAAADALMKATVRNHCKCMRTPKTVSEEEIKYYRNGRMTVDPRKSRAVGLLRMMLDTKVPIKSFLPRNTPTELASMPYSFMDAGQRVYALFYAEWDAWMGPACFKAPPAIEYVEDFEEKMIFKGPQSGDPAHCHFNITCWNPEIGYSFEDHVQEVLASTCDEWRCNREWLKWAITRTEDQDTIKMINSVLAGQHGVKYRHIFHGFVEYHNWHSIWFYNFRIVHEIAAYVVEKKGDAEMMWAERFPEGHLEYHYALQPRATGVSSPPLKSRKGRESETEWDWGIFAHGHSKKNDAGGLA